MSYDLHLFEPVPAEDPIDTLERFAAEGRRAAPDSALRERNRRIAEALMSIHPAFEESDRDYDHLAALEDISPQEARWRHRDVELDDRSGLQVSLYDDHASISFPYWDSVDGAEIADTIAQVAAVVAQRTGWKLYDPQLARFIDPVDDRDELLGVFGVERRRLREHVVRRGGSSPRTAPKARWRERFRRN